VGKLIEVTVVALPSSCTHYASRLCSARSPSDLEILM
jgi:hypothetical protein